MQGELGWIASPLEGGVSPAGYAGGRGAWGRPRWAAVGLLLPRAPQGIAPRWGSSPTGAPQAGVAPGAAGSPRCPVPTDRPKRPELGGAALGSPVTDFSEEVICKRLLEFAARLRWDADKVRAQVAGARSGFEGAADEAALLISPRVSVGAPRCPVPRPAGCLRARLLGAPGLDGAGGARRSLRCLGSPEAS